MLSFLRAYLHGSQCKVLLFTKYNFTIIFFLFCRIILKYHTTNTLYSAHITLVHSFIVYHEQCLLVVTPSTFYTPSCESHSGTADCLINKLRNSENTEIHEEKLQWCRIV